MTRHRAPFSAQHPASGSNLRRAFPAVAVECAGGAISRAPAAPCVMPPHAPATLEAAQSNKQRIVQHLTAATDERQQVASSQVAPPHRPQPFFPLHCGFGPIRLRCLCTPWDAQPPRVALAPPDADAAPPPPATHLPLQDTCSRHFRTWCNPNDPRRQPPTSFFRISLVTALYCAHFPMSFLLNTGFTRHVIWAGGGRRRHGVGVWQRRRCWLSQARSLGEWASSGALYHHLAPHMQRHQE